MTSKQYKNIIKWTLEDTGTEVAAMKLCSTTTTTMPPNPSTLTITGIPKENNFYVGDKFELIACMGNGAFNSVNATWNYDSSKVCICTQFCYHTFFAYVTAINSGTSTITASYAGQTYSFEITTNEFPPTYSFHEKFVLNGMNNNPNKNLTSIEYITIHNTGTYKLGATSAASATFQYNGSGGGSGGSWHYTVDDNEIWQSFTDNRACWHAGDGANGPGNNRSIGIEGCVNWGFTSPNISEKGVKTWSQATQAEKDVAKQKFNKMISNMAYLTAQLLKKHNLSVSNVVQHNNWSGKDCPNEIREGIFGYNWQYFIGLVSDYRNRLN